MIAIENRIVILPIEEKEINDFIVPESKSIKSVKGTVVAVGPGIYQNGILIPMSCKKGDNVYFSKYGGTDIMIDKVNHVVMRESDVLAII